MRKGVRQLIVVARVLSYLWLAGCIVVGVVHWDSPDKPLMKLGMVALSMLPGFAGLGLASILTGFFRPDGQA